MISRILKRKKSRFDFELNIVPIVDVLTILIIFILSSGTFITIGILDVGVASASNQAAEEKKVPEVKVSVYLQPQKHILVSLSGEINKNINIPAANENWDYKNLTRNLASIKNEWKDVKTVTFVPSTAVAYEDVVKGMEIVKDTYPQVLLDGF